MWSRRPYTHGCLSVMRGVVWEVVGEVTGFQILRMGSGGSGVKRSDALV